LCYVCASVSVYVCMGQDRHTLCCIVRRLSHPTTYAYVTVTYATVTKATLTCHVLPHAHTLTAAAAHVHPHSIGHPNQGYPV